MRYKMIDKVKRIIEGTIVDGGYDGFSVVTENGTKDMVGIITSVADREADLIVKSATSRAAIIAKINEGGQSSVGIDADQIVLGGDSIIADGKIRAKLIDADKITAKKLQTEDSTGNGVIDISDQGIRLYSDNELIATINTGDLEEAVPEDE
jgi:hypothetical protein